MQQRRPANDLHQTFLDITDLLEHHRTLEALADSQDRSQRGVAVQLQQRQNAAELQRRLRGFHPADLGFVLEGLEPDDRLQIWAALEPRQAAEAIVELDASVRAWLIGETPKHRLIKIAEALDPDDLAWISDDLPEDVMRQVRESLGEIDRTLLQQADAYPPQSVGTFDEPRRRDRARSADDRGSAARSSGAVGAAGPSRSAVRRRRQESAARRR